jgi:XrtN system VIT domain protein
MLETVHMNTEVEVWPAMHLAYEEKTITVAHKASKQSWVGNQQEAIYIFQLPEGAVVTSLSLWIDGKEEKSVLTTKGKAENAYRTIVGVETRDPSVVHWLEGNRVSVRVFPVIAGEQRIFKIGVTIPLPEKDGQIWLENLRFTGPDAKNATENVKIRLMDDESQNIQTVALKRQQENTYTYSGKYNDALSLALPSKPFSPHAYVHDGKAFRMDGFEPEKKEKHFTNIYADVNAGWNAADWDQLLSAAKGRKIFVYDEGWVEIDARNQDGLFEKLQLRRFTLFPFYHINDNANSLVVTRSANKTPTLEDIRKSSGFEALAKAAGNGKRYYVYNIGQNASLYLSSLRELRLFHYAQGSLTDLMTDLNKQVFDADAESENTSVIYNAGIKITVSEDVSLSNAPDHLLRLFAYNHIMQQGGLRLLADSSLQESSLADLAGYAHIVTPITSMIVLEKKADYERFDIDVNKEGLKNASVQNNGSVPEPHEWAIMLICLLLLAYYHFHLKINFLWLKN